MIRNNEGSASNDVSTDAWRVDCIRCLIMISRGQLSRASKELTKLSEDTTTSRALPTSQMDVALYKGSLLAYLQSEVCALQRHNDESKKWADESIRRVNILIEFAKRATEDGATTVRRTLDSLHDTILGPCLYLLAHVTLRAGQNDESTSCFRLLAQKGLRCSKEARNGIVAALANASDLRGATNECSIYANADDSKGSSPALFNFAALTARAGIDTKSSTTYRQLLMDLTNERRRESNTSGKCRTIRVQEDLLSRIGRPELLYRLVTRRFERTNRRRRWTSLRSFVASLWATIRRETITTMRRLQRRSTVRSVQSRGERHLRAAAMRKV